MQGDEDAAEKLKDAAYYGCGIIGQYQYGTKWNQAERELRNIANGVRGGRTATTKQGTKEIAPLVTYRHNVPWPTR